MPTQEEYIKKLQNYYDEDGKLSQYPTKKPLRVLALTKIAEQIEANKDYTEKEINEIIKGEISFTDVELIRREMYQEKFIDRLRDGSKYWKEIKEE